jgi:hypothetical protein
MVASYSPSEVINHMTEKRLVMVQVAEVTNLFFLGSYSD